MIGQTELFAPDTELPLRQRVQVERISSSVARHVLETYHYLHRVRTGCQIHYSVSIDWIVDGVITYAYPMTSASICDVPSDEMVEFARMYLHSNIPHVASCAIGKTVRRVASDWALRHPTQKPVRMVVSWSDTEYHVGTIYKAANFVWIRKSAGKAGAGGRRPGYRHKRADFEHEKDCWVYFLDKKIREQFGRGIAPQTD